MKPSGSSNQQSLVPLGVAAFLLMSGMTCPGAYVPPHEPFLWDEEAPIIDVHRADVVEAEAAVIRFLRTHRRFEREATDCRSSPRAYRMFTSETPEAYQVILEHNVNFCDRPELLDHPRHISNSPSHGPSVFAVNKKDLRVMRVRFMGDETKQSRAGQPASQKWPPPTYPDGGPEDDSERNECPDGGYVTLEGDFIRLSEHFHQAPIIYRDCINRLIPQDAGADAGRPSRDSGQ